MVQLMIPNQDDSTGRVPICSKVIPAHRSTTRCQPEGGVWMEKLNRSTTEAPIQTAKHHIPDLENPINYHVFAAVSAHEKELA